MDTDDDWNDPSARFFCGSIEFSLDPLRDCAAMWELYSSGKEVKPIEGLDWERIHFNLLGTTHEVIDNTLKATTAPCASVLSGIFRMTRAAHCAATTYGKAYGTVVEWVIYAVAPYVFEAYVEHQWVSARSWIISAHGEREQEARLAFNAILAALAPGCSPESYHCPVDVSILLGGEARVEQNARKQLAQFKRGMLLKSKADISSFMSHEQWPRESS